MAGQVFGLDFGTTNSLLSVIGRDGRPIHLVDPRGRPHPCVVWYRGGEIVVGRTARENLDVGPEAITGSFVRSPKRLLDQDAPIHVGGRDLDPRDVITEVLRFLRHGAATEQPVRHEVDRAVITIPVRLDGAGRRRLREAARKAGISIVQFVHEPLAGLYGHFANNPIIGASYIVPARDKVARPILRRHVRLAIRCSKLPFRAGSDERTA